ncbi:MAG: D-alanyl-D-alanine carboxypeptidase family protein [Gammaproteobacteria bacterium]
MNYRQYLISALLSLSLIVAHAAPEAPKPEAKPVATQPTPATAAAAAQPAPSPPTVTARAYILLDFFSGETLAQLNADQRVEPASLTKLMTGYAVFKALAADKVKLTDPVPITEKAWRSEGSRSFVKVNTQVPLEDLLKGMIIQSGNDASVALAEHVAGSEEGFVTLMNGYAKELGMDHSHFTNSTGLPDPDLYVTARDVATLGRAIIRDFPDYYKYYAIKEFSYNGITQYNRNRLLWRDQNVDGIKTGHTETAGYCLAASALRDGMRLITVVLGTASESIRAKESLEMLNYGFRTFETHRLYDTKTALSTVRVWKGATETLPLGVSKDLYISVPRGQYKNLKATMEIDPAITAPTNKGQRHGLVRVKLGDREILTHPLVALQNVEQGSWWRRLVDTVLLWFK